MQAIGVKASLGSRGTDRSLAKGEGDFGTQKVSETWDSLILVGLQ